MVINMATTPPDNKKTPAILLIRKQTSIENPSEEVLVELRIVLKS